MNGLLWPSRHEWVGLYILTKTYQTVPLCVLHPSFTHARKRSSSLGHSAPRDITPGPLTEIEFYCILFLLLNTWKRLRTTTYTPQISQCQTARTQVTLYGKELFWVTYNCVLWNDQQMYPTKIIQYARIIIFYTQPWKEVISSWEISVCINYMENNQLPLIILSWSSIH